MWYEIPCWILSFLYIFFFWNGSKSSSCGTHLAALLHTYSIQRPLSVFNSVFLLCPSHLDMILLRVCVPGRTISEASDFYLTGIPCLSVSAVKGKANLFFHLNHWLYNLISLSRKYKQKAMAWILPSVKTQDNS